MLLGKGSTVLQVDAATFLANVVQWPHIQPRSIEAMQRIAGAACLGDWQVDVYCPDDGVYALYAMRRPKVGGTLEI